MSAQTFENLVNYMAKKKASDLFITVGLPPCLKLNGSVMPVSKNKLSQADCEEFVLGTMNAEQKIEFKKNKELNFAVVSESAGRYIDR